MSQPNSATDRLEAIRRELDELATKALTSSAEDPAEMLAALGKIAEQAAAGGVGPASQLVRKLREQPPAGYEETLQAIAALETALEEVDSAEPVEHTGRVVREDLVGQPHFGPAARGRKTKSPPLPISADPELLQEFIAESRDHLVAIETNLLAIEQDPQNPEAIHAVFRGFHTIKGLAGFLELPAMQGVAHEIEALLDHVRSGKLRLSPALIDVALEGADFIRTDVGRVAAELAGGAASAPAANEQLIAKVRWAIGATNAEAAQTTVRDGALPMTLGDSRGENSQGESPRVESARAESSRMVRVATGKLDFLVDMVGELVIAQSMIHHDPELSSLPSPALQRNLAQLGRITAEVQKTAMSMRMVPVGQLFQKSARLVRDLTRRQGKLAELEISGEETQLDRTIIEELADPLLHMIRNSADHGLETPAERTAAGKPAHGRIGLKAYHRAGHIVIEVSDDGRGLQRDKILAKARERGLVALGAELNDKEVFNLIFEPGFSTADRVTDISGRGVGMDVVRKQVQKLRGRVEIESQPGRGSTFILKLPLTLAIIDGLVVGVGPERYILPIYAVEEMFRPLAETVFTVENRREMVLIRGNLLPVVRLGQRFGVQARASALADSVLVVAESGETRFCLAVDELLGKREVVIKNLGEMFRDVPGVAGGAILGDGRVGLILDMEGVFRGGANGDGAHA
jgi:two-component system chemotaxis sensor kinase CheA